MTNPIKPLRNRYPGGRSFHEEDQELFFGREHDIEQFTDLLMIKPMIVLLGKSGSGKSSLINAGIIPALQQDGNSHSFVIRFNNYLGDKKTNQLMPVEMTIERLSGPIKGRVNNELSNAVFNKDSFWYWIKQNQYHSTPTSARFILFFEQFEELFTYKPDEVQRFSKQLAQLVYTSVPSSFRKIFEQLESVRQFTESLQDLVYEKPEIQIVFSIRSDRLSQMNVLTDLHPLILQNCYELEALSKDDAKTAIIEPAKIVNDHFKNPPFFYSEDALNKIIESVTNKEDKKIETAILQIVCRHIEEKLVAGRSNVTITAGELGDINTIFQQYYTNVLGKFSGLEKKNVQDLIEEGLITEGRRNTLMHDFIKSKFKISPQALNILEESSLLRKEIFTRNRFLYEIGHDTIAEAVNKIAISHREERIKQNSRKKFKILLGILVAAICGVGITLYMAIRSFELANEKTQLANEEAKLANKYKQALETIKQKDKINAINYAKRNLFFGDQQFRNHNTGQALIDYRTARDTLRNYTNDTLYIQIEQKIKQLQ